MNASMSSAEAVIEKTHHIHGWLIIGTTRDGAAFRPSNWAERICEILAITNDRGIVRYHDDLRPIYTHGLFAVHVGRNLKDTHPNTWRELLQFVELHQIKMEEQSIDYLIQSCRIPVAQINTKQGNEHGINAHQVASK